MTFAAGMIVLAGCHTTSPDPAPAPAVPPHTIPAPPPVQPPPPVTRWRVGTPGAPADYVLDSRAVIHAHADSLQRTDTLDTHVALRFTPRGAALDITVSTYTVQPSGGLPPRATTAPARGLGRFNATGAFALDPPMRGRCGSMPATALESTREIWVRPPQELSVGDHWKDSVTVPVCRDSVLLQLHVDNEYHVTATDGEGAARTFSIARSTTMSIDGRGPIRGDTTLVTGRGTGTATLVLASNGLLTSGTGTSTLELAARGATRTQLVTQTTTLSFRQSDGMRER
jgi:hypothetical protein